MSEPSDNAPGKKSFLLRIDARLWAELQAWAGDDLRSVNGQIEYLLRQAVQARRRGKPARLSDDGEKPPPQA